MANFNRTFTIPSNPGIIYETNPTEPFDPAVGYPVNGIQFIRTDILGANFPQVLLQCRLASDTSWLIIGGPLILGISDSINILTWDYYRFVTNKVNAPGTVVASFFYNAVDVVSFDGEISLPNNASTSSLQITLNELVTETNLLITDTNSLLTEIDTTNSLIGAGNDLINSTNNLITESNNNLNSIDDNLSVINDNINNLNLKFINGNDIGDVTINNSSGPNAVNIQDGGNSITVDGTVKLEQSSSSNYYRLSLTTSNQTLLNSNPNRKGCVFFNEGGDFIYLKFGITASPTSYTLQIPSRSSYELSMPIYQGRIDAVAHGGTQILNVTELI